MSEEELSSSTPATSGETLLERVEAEAEKVEGAVVTEAEKVAEEIKAAVHRITHIGFGRHSADEAPTQTTESGVNHGS